MKNLKSKEKLKKNKGITLVALIITIVILLIVAAVSIGGIAEKALIGRSEQAKDEYEGQSRNYRVQRTDCGFGE